MRLVATLFLVAAVASLVAGALQLAIIAAIIFGAIFRLRQCLTFLAFLALVGFVGCFPWAFAVTMGLALVVNWVGAARPRQSPNRPLPRLHRPRRRD